jgi:hypothetical protein
MAAALAFPNIYEQHARQVKAGPLADVLDALHITSAQGSKLSPTQWRCFAEIAMVRVPSDDTKRIVLDILRTREHIRERVAHCVLDGLSCLA